MSCSNPLKPFSLFLVIFFLAPLFLTGCNKPPPESQGSISVEYTERTIDLYSSSCSTCHESSATGAPQTGDSLAWQPRIDKGMDALLENAINGFSGMPPLGLCMECTKDDFEALIQYMASEQLSNPV